MTNFNKLEQFLNEKEVAERLNIKPETLRNWRWAKSGLKFYKFGSNVRYKISDVKKYIEKQSRNSTSDTGEFNHD